MYARSLIWHTNELWTSGALTPCSKVNLVLYSTVREPGGHPHNLIPRWQGCRDGKNRAALTPRVSLRQILKRPSRLMTFPPTAHNAHVENFKTTAMFRVPWFWRPSDNEENHIAFITSWELPSYKCPALSKIWNMHLMTITPAHEENDRLAIHDLLYWHWRILKITGQLNYWGNNCESSCERRCRVWNNCKRYLKMFEWSRQLCHVESQTSRGASRAVRFLENVAVFSTSSASDSKSYQAPHKDSSERPAAHFRT